MATTNLVVNFSAGAIAGEWRGSVDDRIANAVLSLLVASSQMQKQIAATSTPTEPKDEQQAGCICGGLGCLNCDPPQQQNKHNYGSKLK